MGEYDVTCENISEYYVTTCESDVTNHNMSEYDVTIYESDVYSIMAGGEMLLALIWEVVPK